jgi:tetratricopeptide (TPR) repeat protein
MTMSRPLSWGIILILVACILGGQALVDDGTTASGVTQVGSAAGRAGFAYLTGLRRFTALLLWNRIEPQFHEYYGGKPLNDQTFMLPNLRLVVALDPQFIQAYYVAPWVVRANGRAADAIAIAREGVENNPRSGLLHSALAQILFLRAGELDAAVAQADLAMRPDQVWADATEQWQGIRMLRDIYAKAGLPAKVAETDRVTALLESDLGGAPGFRDPDEQF